MTYATIHTGNEQQHSVMVVMLMSIVTIALLVQTTCTMEPFLESKSLQESDTTFEGESWFFFVSFYAGFSAFVNYCAGSRSTRSSTPYKTKWWVCFFPLLWGKILEVHINYRDREGFARRFWRKYKHLKFEMYLDINWYWSIEGVTAEYKIKSN